MRKRLSIIMVIAVCALMAFSVPAFAVDAGQSQNQSQTVGENATNSQAQAGIYSNFTDNRTINIEAMEQKDLTSVNNNGHGYRGFANPAEIHYPALPAYFGNATPGSSFQSCKVALMYKNTFTVKELKKLAKGSLGSKDIVTPLVDKVPEEERSDSIKMLIRKPNEGTDVKLLGYITVKATGSNTVSMEILAEAALKARELGANAIHITAEGVDRELKAFGWGIGLAYTSAHINNDETQGGVAAGGTGISGGSAGYKDMPWFQVFALKIQYKGK